MSSFAPTQAEVALVQEIFAKNDPQKLGILTGEIAVKAFQGAQLPPSILGEVWAIADKENNGFLTRKGIAIAVRLIGYAQKGVAVKEALLDRVGPLATFDNIGSSPSRSSTPAPTSPTPRAPSFPTLSAQDKAKFARLFASCSPSNGLISGDKAREVFLKSKLPVEKLSQIWNLADTQKRGVLDQTDFTIAMYLIQGSMSGTLATLPSTLPSVMYEQAGGRTPTASVISHSTGNSGPVSPTLSGFQTVAAPIAAQYTGQSLKPQITGQALNTKPAIPSRLSTAPITAFGASAFPAAQTWDVTPEEKTNSDRFFDGLDTQKRGYIEGDIAVQFLLQSKLSGEILAQVWDLADLNNDGKLTRDGFAVAMHLIQGKLAGKEIPQTLPESLIPPYLRKKPAASAAPPLSDVFGDLLGDDSPPASGAVRSASPAPIHAPAKVPPQITGSQFSVFPQHTGLSQQTTGNGSAYKTVSSTPFGSSPTPTNRALTSSFHNDLLGDDDEHANGTTPQLHDNSAEIGNLQNQLNSTNQSFEKAKAERQNLEQLLSNQAAQLSALQTQLSSAKAAYETESRLLDAFKERYATQSAEIQKAKEELITAESDLSAIKDEKGEVGNSLLRDKDEVRELQRRMKEVGDEIEQLKLTVEKTKKEAKQQKGLLAIAKKQLSTREAERAKAAQEAAEAEAELDGASQELKEAEEELAAEPDIPAVKAASPAAMVTELPPRMDTPSFAAAQPLPESVVTSPFLVTSPNGKSNNPFERLAFGSGSSSPAPVPTADVFSASTPQLKESVTANEDPFGFSEPEVPVSAPQAMSTDLGPDVDNIFTSVVTDEPMHIDGSRGPSPLPEIAPAKLGTSEFPELAEAAAHFPAVDFNSPKLDTTETSKGKERETEFSSPLHELDVEESDSDSEDETHPVTNNTSMAATEEPIKPHPDTSSNTFEDIFATEPVQPQITSSAVNESTPFGNNPFPDAVAPAAVPVSNGVFEQSTDITPITTAAQEKPVAGVKDFDEAMGQLASKNTGNGDVFKFDSAFDDEFDFKAASAEVPPLSVQPTPASANQTAVKESVVPSGGFDDVFGTHPSQPTTAPIPNVAVASTQPNGKQPADNTFLSFDNAFGEPAPSATAAPSPPTAPAADHGISFDDVFGGSDQASKALALAPSFGTPANPPQAFSPPQEPPPPSNNVSPLYSPPQGPPPIIQAPASPSSTIGSGQRTRHSMSPPPPSSPSRRDSSPKPRLSITGSSKDGPVAEKHTKRGLSIRLPFGRKDKARKNSKHEPPPLPHAAPPTLSPVPEPIGIVTPGVDDDVEPVKQLCNMGFSRTQAVAALENNSYDFQTALNSLLETA